MMIQPLFMFNQNAKTGTTPNYINKTLLNAPIKDTVSFGAAKLPLLEVSESFVTPILETFESMAMSFNRHFSPQEQAEEFFKVVNSSKNKILTQILPESSKVALTRDSQVIKYCEQTNITAYKNLDEVVFEEENRDGRILNSLTIIPKEKAVIYMGNLCGENPLVKTAKL